MIGFGSGRGYFLGWWEEWNVTPLFFASGFVSVFLGWPWTRVEQVLEGWKEKRRIYGPNNQTRACPLGGMGFWVSWVLGRFNLRNVVNQI